VPEDKEKENDLSRLEKYQREDAEPPPPPPLGEFGYLINWLFEVGPIINGGMGQSPLSFQEIKAWNDLMGINLTGNEAIILHKLSSVYLSEYQHRELNRSCPSDNEYIEDTRKKVSGQFQALLKGK